jgi:nitric oxide reductase NorD protein
VAGTDQTAAIDAALARLAARSEDAHREALAARPVIARHGARVLLEWLQACVELVAHDLDGGRALIRGSVAAATASEEVLPWTAQARRFRRWRGSGRAVEGFMEKLPVAFGSLGHAGQRRWAEIGLTWCRRHLASGTAYFATPIRELTGRQGIGGLEALATTAEELFERRNLMLATYLPGAVRVRNLFGHAAVLPWALRGCDVLQRDRVRGETYFRLESEESLAQLLDGHSGFRVRDRERLIAMLLHAWLGAEIALEPSGWSPEQGRPFVEVDAHAVYLPLMLPSREEALLGSLHAAGHVRFGTFDIGSLRGLAGASVDPACPLKVLLPLLIAPWQDDAVSFLLCFDLCEDLRVDARLGAAVPNYLARLARLAEQTPWTAAAAHRAFAVKTLRLARGNSDHGLAPAIAERLSPLLDATATVADAFVCARWLHARSVLPDVATEELADAYLPARGPNLLRVLRKATSTQDGAQRSGDAAQPLASEPQPPEPTGAEEDALRDVSQEQVMTETGAAVHRSGESRRRRGGMRTPSAASNPRGRPYPEWDYREGRYKRDWAWVQERELGETNAAEAGRIAARHRRALQQLKRAMQAQKPTRLAPRRRQLEGEDIDLDAAVGFVVERHGGRAPNAAVYRRRVPAQRDISVILLADLSTSIMQLVPRGGGRLVDRVRAGILLFAESLEVVGDGYSIGGFCSKYRENVTWYPIKDFDEPLSARVRGIVGGLSGRLATRMGAAIRHAVTRFDGVESRRRLLLIVSDGRPEDYDDGGDHRYLHEDTRMAVKEAVAAGVHPFCVTVDALGQEYLPQIFGKGHYLVLDQIDQLPAKLPEIYLRLRR